MGEHEPLLAISPAGLQDRYPSIVVELDRAEVESLLDPIELPSQEFDDLGVLVWRHRIGDDAWRRSKSTVPKVRRPQLVGMATLVTARAGRVRRARSRPCHDA